MNYTHWIRTSLGLEEVALDELKEKMGPIEGSQIGHRSVFVKINPKVSDVGTFKSLRTVDDIYELVGVFEGVDKTKSSLDALEGYFKKEVLPHILSTKKSYSGFRSTVSFLGERNFNRFSVESKINIIVSEATGLSVFSNESGESHVEGEMRLRCHIDGQLAYFGIAIFDTPLHRREWRTETYEGQLHPPIAAAMARIARAKSPRRIVDPFCGSGTILIESLAINPRVKHEGFDISEQAVEVAQANALRAGVVLPLLRGNAFEHLDSCRGAIIVSNPPWGNKHSIENDENAEFSGKLMNLILESDGAILITTEDIIEKLSSGILSVQEILRSRVNGKIAVVSFLKRKN